MFRTVAANGSNKLPARFCVRAWPEGRCNLPHTFPMKPNELSLRFLRRPRMCNETSNLFRCEDFYRSSSRLPVYSPPPQGNNLSAQTGCSSTTPPCVLTGQYGNLRQAYNPYETAITPSNVSNMAEVSWPPLQLTGDSLPSSTLNEVFAQPLYVAGISTSLTNCTPACTFPPAASKRAVRIRAVPRRHARAFSYSSSLTKLRLSRTPARRRAGVLQSTKEKPK
jgi:hypothetical protein